MGLKTFKSGAVRTKDADSEAYHLICPKGLKYLSKIYLEGENKYPLKTNSGVVGSTYVRGMGFGDTLNHMIRHIEIAKMGGDHEGGPVVHLAKVAWGCFTLIHYLRGCKCHRELYKLEKQTRKGWDAHYLEEEKNEDN